jgi:deoxyadenosine/deoxycytidine kinase
MISVIGPVGSGKSSFASALSELIGYAHVPEYIDMDNVSLCRIYDVESSEDALQKWKYGEWRLYRFQQFIIDSTIDFIKKLNYCYPLVVETPPGVQFEIFIEGQPNSLISDEEKTDLRERLYQVCSEYRLPWLTDFKYVEREWGATAQMIEMADGEWDVVYCNTPPEQCFENIMSRGRSAESSYTIDMCYEDYRRYTEFVSKRGVKC